MNSYYLPNEIYINFLKYVKQNKMFCGLNLYLEKYGVNGYAEIKVLWNDEKLFILKLIKTENDYDVLLNDVKDNDKDENMNICDYDTFENLSSLKFEMKRMPNELSKFITYEKLMEGICLLKQ